MKRYEIKQIVETPDWEKIPSLNIDTPYYDTPNCITANAKITYDKDALYINLSTTEPEIRAVENGLLGSPCEDSCLEFFFCPIENDSRYFNIEFNSNGCVYLGLGSSVDDLIRLIVPNLELIFEPKITKREDGWGIVYKVPFTFVQRIFPEFNVYSGKTIRANCYKCADKTNPPHYLSWSPIISDRFTFHTPTCFGEMIFSN